MIIRPRGQLWEHSCDNCDASWYGPEDDDCYWCERRAERIRDSIRRRLLFPEWWNWSERFGECSHIDQTIWAETRGLRGKYVEQWERELSREVALGTITDTERALALRRNAQWISTHSEKHVG